LDLHRILRNQEKNVLVFTAKTDILPIKMESIILELIMGVKDIEDKEDEVS